MCTYVCKDKQIYVCMYVCTLELFVVKVKCGGGGNTLAVGDKCEHSDEYVFVVVVVVGTFEVIHTHTYVHMFGII